MTKKTKYSSVPQTNLYTKSTIQEKQKQLQLEKRIGTKPK